MIHLRTYEVIQVNPCYTNHNFPEKKKEIPSVILCIEIFN